MKLNIMLSRLVLLGLVGGLLMNSGCVPGPDSETRVVSTHKDLVVRTYIDEKALQNITGNKLIKCTNIKIALSFLDSNTQYLARSIINSGSRCMIYFDPSEFGMSDLQARGYTLYIYQNDSCAAAFYKAPHAKPFFSSAC